jgi:hypothetical protein
MLGDVLYAVRSDVLKAERSILVVRDSRLEVGVR